MNVQTKDLGHWNSLEEARQEAQRLKAETERASWPGGIFSIRNVTQEQDGRYILHYTYYYSPS